MRVVKFFLFFYLVIVPFAIYFFFAHLPDVNILKTHYPVVTYNAAEKRGDITLDAQKPKTWVSVKEIPKQAWGALVVSEDWAFFQHGGFDPNQLQLALQDSLEKGHLGRGASTITQQVVKNIFLSNERSLWRKALELYLAIKLEGALNKWKILELYINIAEMGPGIFGIGQAARYYFSKSPAQLNAREGAFLAMLLPSPVRYGQSFREKKLTKFAKRTVENILDKMVQAAYLTLEEREAINAVQLPFESMPEAKEVETADASAPPAEEPATAPTEDISVPVETNPAPTVENTETPISTGDI